MRPLPLPATALALALALGGCKAKAAPPAAPRPEPFDAAAYVRDFQAALPERLALLSVVDTLWSKVQEEDVPGFMRYVSKDFRAPGTGFPNYCALKRRLSGGVFARVKDLPTSLVPNDTRVAGEGGLAMIDLVWTDAAGAERRGLGLELRFKKEDGQWRVSEALPASGEALTEALGRAPPAAGDPLAGLEVRTESMAVKDARATALFASLAQERARPAYFELRNDGAEIVESPRILADDGVDGYDRKSFVRGVVDPGWSEEAKALALYKAYTDRRYSYCNRIGFGEYQPEFHDPVKLLHAYGYGCCGENATAFIRLAEAAGLSGRRAALGDHVVSEVSFGGAWRMLDADTRMFFTRADGVVAGLADLEAKPELVGRTLSPSGRTAAGHDGMLVQYTKAEAHSIDRMAPDADAHTLRWGLRPGERMSFYPLGVGAAYDAPPGPMRVANAILETELRPGGFAAQSKAFAFDNLRAAKDGAAFDRIDASRPGAVTIPVAVPYVIVGAEAAVDFDGGDAGEVWTEVRSARTDDLWRTLSQTAPDRPAGTLDADAEKYARGLYRYSIRFEIRGAARASALRVRTVMQVAPLSLPSLRGPIRVLTGAPGEASAPPAGLTLTVGAYTEGESDAGCD